MIGLFAIIHDCTLWHYYSLLLHLSLLLLLRLVWRYYSLLFAPIIRYYCSLFFLLFSIMAGCLPLDIWNPVPLDRIRQNGTYWYVPVRTSTTLYKTVREFDGSTYRYVPVHTGTYFQQDKLFSDSPRKSQER